jgi:hypothetical protein
MRKRKIIKIWKEREKRKNVNFVFMQSQYTTGPYCDQQTPLMGYCNSLQTTELMEMMDGDQNKDVGEVFVAGSTGDGSKQSKKGVPNPRY